MLVYLNGSFIDHAGARVSIDDRGFLFADGIYEVIRVYGGRPFLPEDHIGRLQRGLAAIRIDPGAAEGIVQIAERLLAENELREHNAIIYIQVTRGEAPRKHAFPEPGTKPTIYVSTKPFPRPAAEHFAHGVPVITVPDTRWSRCDIKSVALLPNVLANQQAKEAGAFEAIFVRDGVLIEASHSNFMGVIGGAVVTYPECNYILGGITRRFVLELAGELGMRTREAPILLERFNDIEELFLTGTTTEIMPITRLDGRPVGEGRVGEIARRLQQAYYEAALAATAGR